MGSPLTMGPPLMMGFLTLAACALVFLLPLLSRPLARLLWRSRPLDPGALRGRLEALSLRAGVPVRDILVVPAGARRLAAGRILGLTPGTRCVLLSAELVAAKPPGDVEAVFAHELGHARRGHQLGVCIYLSGFLLCLLAAREAWPLLLLALLWLGAGWGWISRRFERQADLWAAELIGPERYRESLKSIDIWTRRCYAQGSSKEQAMSRSSRFHRAMKRRKELERQSKKKEKAERREALRKAAAEAKARGEEVFTSDQEMVAGEASEEELETASEEATEEEEAEEEAGANKQEQKD